MLEDIKHLVVGTDLASVEIGGNYCRPITLHSFALMEITGNEILSESSKMIDVLGFIYLHSAPEAEIADVISEYISGNKTKYLKAVLGQKKIALTEMSNIAVKIRQMIETSLGSAATNSSEVEGNEKAQAAL